MPYFWFVTFNDNGRPKIIGPNESYSGAQQYADNMDDTREFHIVETDTRHVGEAKAKLMKEYNVDVNHATMNADRKSNNTGNIVKRTDPSNDYRTELRAELGKYR